MKCHINIHWQQYLPVFRHIERDRQEQTTRWVGFQQADCHRRLGQDPASKMHSSHAYTSCAHYSQHKEPEFLPPPSLNKSNQ